MTISRVQIEAASRLHFGLFSFGQDESHQYGGVGLMVDSPGLCLVAERAQQLVTDGPLASRIEEFARRWQQFNSDGGTTECRLRLLRSAPHHVGLGTGTQLGLAVAVALYRLNDWPLPDAATLAASVGRGRRSSVGTHGFLHGGLIVDGGKVPGQQLGPLAARVTLPDQWRVVQICPARRSGLCGKAETQAFRQLPAVPASVTERLLARIHDQLLPAARSGDFDEFSESVYQYGHQSGNCFACQQGGPFADELTEWVAALRGRGVRGVGQSSWGPTLYALAASAEDARELLAWARREGPMRDDNVQLRISRIANHGARCVVHDPTTGPLTGSSAGL
jgi:beta-RFAP synthase